MSYDLKRIMFVIFLAPIWIPLFLLFLIIIPEYELENQDIVDI